MAAGSVLQTTRPPASAALRGVGRGYKQEKLGRERRVPGQGLRGRRFWGVTASLWWLLRGVSDYWVPEADGRMVQSLSVCWAVGTDQWAKVGKGPASLELCFV